jgi:AhpD family alkylhydroperoxidase
MNQRAEDLKMGASSEVSPKQLRELHIRVVKAELTHKSFRDLMPRPLWQISMSSHHIRSAWGGQEDDMPDKSTLPRLDITKVSPDLYKAMAGLQNYVETSGLDQKLLDLVKIRASQINGCAYCIVMHTNDARKHGESDEWMHLLDAWREAPIYSARERAALAWTEAVTKISDHHVPDEVYDEARQYFSEKELVDLTAAVIAINAWNRAAIAFRATPRLTNAKLAA